ncbi:MAG: hypothetical protein DRG83_16430 [Deltaproteobacteria bacterium]|nr:MAG: hypothetical protein DRG83_16430 [Deltaproteobacteria bacterium]
MMLETLFFSSKSPTKEGHHEKITNKPEVRLRKELLKGGLNKQEFLLGELRSPGDKGRKLMATPFYRNSRT